MAVNVRVENKYGFEATMRAFERACGNAKILKEIKKREFYEKPSEKKRRKNRQIEKELEKQRKLRSERNPQNRNKGR